MSISLAAVMIMTSRPGTVWARSGADGVFEIPVHPDLPTILRLPDAITGARVTGSPTGVTFAGRALHVRPRAGVSAGLEALLEVEMMTMRLTFRLRVVERHEDALDDLVVVVMPSERAEQSPPEGEVVPDASPEIPVHARVTTILHLPDKLVRARFTGVVTGMMRAINIDDRLLIRPNTRLSAGTEVALRVQTATVRQRFRLRVVRRPADTWRHVAVLPPPASSSATLPESRRATASTMLARAVRTVIEGLHASENARAPEREPEPTPPKAAASAAAPAPVASMTRHATAPATEHADAAARPPRVAISIHAVVALAGTTELTRPGYNATQARRPHRAIGIRVTGRRPGASWGVEANVSGEWPAAPTVHAGDRDTVLKMRGPWLRADVGLKTWFGTGLVPTASVGLGLQAHHRDVDIAPDNSTPESGPSGDIPFGGVLAASMGLEYRMKRLSLGIELHVRQGVPAEYRSVSALLSLGWSLDQGE